MPSRTRLERIHRVRTLQLGMVRADEVAAHAKFASEAALRNRIASLADSIAPAPEASAGFTFAASAHYRERLHISAEAAENRLANAVARVEAAGEQTREARRDQSAIEKLLGREAALEALAEIRKLEVAPPPRRVRHDPC